MKDYDLAGVLAGMFFLVIGVVLLAVSVMIWPLIFYALICLGVGIAILVTLRKQDEIEQIKQEQKVIKKKKK